MAEQASVDRVTAGAGGSRSAPRAVGRRGDTHGVSEFDAEMVPTPRSPDLLVSHPSSHVRSSRTSLNQWTSPTNPASRWESSTQSLQSTPPGAPPPKRSSTIGAVPPESTRALVVVAADSNGISRARHAARALAAMRDITDDQARLKRFNQEQGQQLAARLSDAEARLPQEIAMAYRHVVALGRPGLASSRSQLRSAGYGSRSSSARTRQCEGFGSGLGCALTLAHVLVRGPVAWQCPHPGAVGSPAAFLERVRWEHARPCRAASRSPPRVTRTPQPGHPLFAVGSAAATPPRRSRNGGRRLGWWWRSFAARTGPTPRSRARRPCCARSCGPCARTAANRMLERSGRPTVKQSGVDPVRLKARPDSVRTPGWSS